MKSKTSFFNKTIFLKNITHFWPIWVLILLWNLFIMPFFIYSMSLNYRDNMGRQYADAADIAVERSNDILNVVNVFINPIMLFLFSTVAVMAVFSYLYNARAANTMHAFPVTRAELFCTNYLSGLLFLIFPEAVAFLTGTLVSAMCGYTGMNYLLLGFLCAVGISFIFYSFTVCIAMFTGQLFAVPVFAGILNVLYVGCKAMFLLVVSAISYGISETFVSSKADMLSPLWYLSKNVGIVRKFRENGILEITGVKGIGLIWGYAAAACVAVVLAYLIYRKRNMETAGSLLSVKWIAPVFRWGVAFCGGALFSLIFYNIFGAVSSQAQFVSMLLSFCLSGGCFFFAAQMFVEKGFRVFHKKRIRECGLLLAVLACVLTAVEFDFFGQEKKVPAADKIDRVYLETYYSLVGTNEGGEDPLLSQILDVHRKIIAAKQEVEAYTEGDVDISNVRIKYFLKDGSMLKRSYLLPTAEDCETSSSILRRMGEMTARPDAYKRCLFGTDTDSIRIESCNFDLYREDVEWTSTQYEGEDAKLLYEAVLADIDEGNFRDVIMRNYNGGNPEKPGYANNLGMSFYSDAPIIPANQGHFTSEWEEDAAESGYANIEFDSNCRNVINALIRIGAIESEDDLTLSEYEADVVDTIEYK